MSTDQEKEKKLQEFWEKARKGVLKHLDDKGGKLTLSELHDYSMNIYFIQHQRFSQMMEGFVGENLIYFDSDTQEISISEEGKKFVKQG